MTTTELDTLILESLDDLKAQNTLFLDVSSLTDVMDNLVIASGTSTRHVKSLAENVITTCKKNNQYAIGIEGMEVGDWVLVDFGNTVVHVMLPETRQFYDLEKLWTS